MKTKHLSIKELAAFMGVSTDTIRRAVRRGEIPATRVGTALRFDLHEVRTCMERNAEVKVGTANHRKSRAPMQGKNIWRLCKTYGRLIGYPMLKPHDLRHGVAMEVLEQQHDLEQVRALLGPARIDTTQIYTMIRPSHLKQVVSFYEEPARRMQTS